MAIVRDIGLTALHEDIMTSRDRYFYVFESIGINSKHTFNGDQFRHEIKVDHRTEFGEIMVRWTRR